jgi:hypothetical protein
MEEGSKSIVTRYQFNSVVSGYQRECRHHLIFGRGKRDLAEEDGLWIPLTHREHNLAPSTINRIHENSMAEILSKMLGQMAFEKEFYRRQLFSSDQDPARDAFRIRYGESYL